MQYESHIIISRMAYGDLKIIYCSLEFSLAILIKDEKSLNATQNPFVLMPILLLIWGSVAAVSKLVLNRLDSYQVFILYVRHGCGHICSHFSHRNVGEALQGLEIFGVASGARLRSMYVLI